MTAFTKYYRTSCHIEDPYLKTIPVSPFDAESSIRAGCEECGGIRRFNRLGGRP